MVRLRRICGRDRLPGQHLRLSRRQAARQWYDSRVIDSSTDRKVFYDFDTFGGQSGAAVYRILNGQRTAFGVHAYGGARVNSATRINRFVFDNIAAWKSASEGG